MSVYGDVISILNQVAVLYFSFYSLSLSLKLFCHCQKTRVTKKLTFYPTILTINKKFLK